MHESHIITDVALIFGTGVAVAFVFRRLRAPSIVGFLIAGMMIGPDALHFVSREQVAPFSEVGLILLLFLIGLELSPKPLVRMGRSLLIAALVQMGGTALVTFGVVTVFGSLPIQAALILGMATALSSTAIVLAQLSDRGETGSSTGMIITGILLLQDVAVIIVMLTLPLLATTSGNDVAGVALRTGIGLTVVIAGFMFGREPINWFLNGFVRAGGRELTTLFAVLAACGGAWLAVQVGWSPALGACIAGLMLAGVDMRHQIMADVMPFRDVFNALFFIVLGIMVDLQALAEHWLIVGLAIAGTFVLKTLITAGAVRIAGWPARHAIHAGLALCTVSEFGYVLILEASRYGFVSDSLFGIMTVYAVGTMVAGAPFVPAAGFIAKRFTGSKAKDEESVLQEDDGGHAHALDNHVMVIGYGITGQSLARVLDETRIPYCVVEMNPNLVQKALAAKAHVVVGDAGRKVILQHAGLANARAVVVAINDTPTTERIISVARAARPEVFILARTQFDADLDRLYETGADRVISEDFEASIEMLAHLLREMGIPDNIVDAQIAAVRSGRYAMFRGKATDRAAQAELMAVLQRTATRTHYLTGQCAAAGHTIAELDLRARSGVTIIAVVRNQVATTNPAADFALTEGDLLVLVGSHEQLDRATNLLSHGDMEKPPETLHAPQGGVEINKPR